MDFALAGRGVEVARTVCIWRRCRSIGRLVGTAVALLALNPGLAGSAPLLQSQEPGRDEAQTATQPADSGGGWSGVASGASTDIAFQLQGGSVSAGAGLDLAAMQGAPLFDPAEEGLQAVAQSLRDSATVRQVLGATVGLRDNRAPPDPRDEAAGGVLVADALGPTDARSGIVEPLRDTERQAQDAGQQPGGKDRKSPPRKAPQRGQSDDVLDTSLVQQDGPTLRTVLRSLVRVRKPAERRKPRTVADSISDAAADVIDDGLSLGERLLDSQMLGEAVRTIITRPADYEIDNSFSILGHGKFEMELDLSADLGEVSLSERTSGTSVSMALEPKLTYDTEERRRPPQEKIDLMQIISNFVRSATGVSLIIISGILLLVLGMFRFAMVLRR